MAYECLEGGGSYPIILNAANEIAVDAFLNHKIKFNQICLLIEKTLQGFSSQNKLKTIDEILSVDFESRVKANEILNEVRFA